MAQKKKSSAARADRVIRKASDGSVVDRASADKRPPGAQKSAAGQKRIIAYVLWALAIAAEVAAIWTFNHFSVLWPSLAAIAADAAFCIAAAQFWKQANHLDPPKGKFFKNQFGVLMAMIAFLPLGYFLLKNSKDMPASARKILAIVAAFAFILTMGLSIDYNPTSQEDLTQAELMAIENGGVAYWGKYSKSYHFDPDCQTLVNSKEIFEGTVEEAFDLGKTDPCDFCAGGGENKSILENVLVNSEEDPDTAAAE